MGNPKIYAGVLLLRIVLKLTSAALAFAGIYHVIVPTEKQLDAQGKAVPIRNVELIKGLLIAALVLYVVAYLLSFYTLGPKIAPIFRR